MKRFFILSSIAILLCSLNLFSLPNFWYSGVAYNTMGQIVANGSLEVNVTITDGSSTYVENFLSGGTGPVSSDAFGVVSVNVGTGTTVSGTLSSITMAATTKITVKVRPVGSTTWVTIVGAPLSITYVNQYVNLGSITLEDAHILIGNSDDQAVEQIVSGDATLSNTGNLQITSGVIVNADINTNAQIDVNKLAEGTTTGQILRTNGTNVEWSTVANAMADLTNGAGIASFIYDGSSAQTVALANGTAAGQVYVTGATPFTPALVTMGGDAVISSVGSVTIQNSAGNNIVAAINNGLTTNKITVDKINKGTVNQVLLTPSPLADPVWGKITSVNMTAGDYSSVINTGNYSINITGNAGTVTNGVYTTGSYADPSWITSLAGSKISGDITGNAGSATKLQTARTINGVSFDGTADITLPTWDRAGNAITTGQFIGTTNNQDLVFKVNNQESGRLNEVLDNYSFGQGALSSSPSGGANVAFGQNSLQKNTTAHSNSGFGYGTLTNNTTGLYNTALGAWALYGNLSGSHNTAVGSGALWLDPTGITTGDDNTALGYNANVNAGNLNNVIVIGSGAIATASNQTMIGNSSTASVYLKGANTVTTVNAPNMYVNANGQIMASTATVITAEVDPKVATATSNVYARWNSSTNKLVDGIIVENGSANGIIINGYTQAQAVFPNGNNTYDLGTTSLRWRDLFVSGNSIHMGASAGDEVNLAYSSGTMTINKPTQITGNLLPATDVTYNLGSSSQKWNNAYAATFNGNLVGNVTGNVTGNAGTVTNGVYTSRTISTTAPLTGGGNLGSDLNLGISAATPSAAGSMSAADKTKLDGLYNDFSTVANVTSNSPGNLATDDFVFGSSQLNNDNNSDHYYRMFFDKSKGAFRVGYDGNSFYGWDDANRGIASMAWGEKTTASSNGSTAWGNYTVSSGIDATAWGSYAVASNSNSTAWGFETTASGIVATAWGNKTTANSYLQTTFGQYNTSISGTPNAWVATEPLFVIGNGTSDLARANALVMLKNGNTTLSGTITASNLSGTNTGDQTLAGLGGQPLDADLTSLAALSETTSNQMIISAGADSWTALAAPTTSGQVLQYDGSNVAWADLPPAGWGLTGNSGTTAGTNFIGTTDNVDVVFKRGGTVSGWINSTVNNTSFGYNSLPLTTTGLTNSAFGYKSLNANTSGSGNSALGNAAMVKNTTGSNNAAFGGGALNNNIDGSFNSAFGQIALYDNTSGTNNTALGNAAFQFNTTGSYNIGIGYNAGSYAANGIDRNTTTGNSIYIGPNTRSSANGNTEEIVIGYGAIGHGTRSITLGSSNNNQLYSQAAYGSYSSDAPNMAVRSDGYILRSQPGAGYNGKVLTVVSGVPAWGDLPPAGWGLSGNSITAGQFIGTTNAQDLIFKVSNTQAGRLDNTNGNTSFGKGALNPGTTGAQNSAFGEAALASNTIGTNNVAIGGYSLRANTTGGENIAIGINSLNANLIGNSNIAIGTAALLKNTASSNTAVGASAMQENTDGFQNTALGAIALQANTTGYSNTALGNSALFLNTEGHDNVAIGQDAMGENTTGSNNVAIGSLAGFSSVATSNSIAIGYQAQASADNQTVIGNEDITTVYLKGAGTATTASAPNMYVDAISGQIMRSTASFLTTELDPVWTAAQNTNPTTISPAWTFNSDLTVDSPTGSANFYVQNNGTPVFSVDGTQGDITTAGNIIPSSTTQTLGTSSNRWQDVFVTGASLHIGADGDEALIGYNTTDNELTIDQTVAVKGSVLVNNASDQNRAMMSYGDVLGTSAWMVGTGEYNQTTPKGAYLMYNETAVDPFPAGAHFMMFNGDPIPTFWIMPDGTVNANDANFNGTVTLGSSLTDYIYVGGTISNDGSPVTFAAQIIPDQDNIRDLGAISRRWANVYAAAFTGNLTGNVTGNVTGNISGTATNVTGTVAVTNGGTGVTTTPANGQIPIGNGTGYTVASLTAGTGISITNGSGSITIASTNVFVPANFKPTSTTITTSSSTAFTVPAGVYTITIEACGGTGGGGGSGADYGSSSNQGATGGGGAGGAGEYVGTIINVQPGDIVGVTIGTAGSGGSAGQTSGTPSYNGGSGGTGGNTIVTLNSSTILTAHGGFGGNGSVGNNAATNSSGGTGGIGGTGSTDMKHLNGNDGSEGSGSTGNGTSVGGGGTCLAGPNPTGITTNYGGQGANGIYSNTGGRVANGNTGYAGNTGRVVITYY